MLERVDRFAPLLAAVIGASAAAQSGPPAISAVANHASLAPACSAHGGIAPGSVIAIDGSGFTPGATVRVVAAGSARQLRTLSVTPSRIAAVLPRDLPTGDATVTVASSPGANLTLRRHAFGLFTTGRRAVLSKLNPAGELVPGVSLAPGETGVLWGTGLGPDPPDLTVWIGGQPARVLYRGSSGCCPGIDLVAFETPANVTGCETPIQVEADGVPSNIAIASVGTCRPRDLPPPIDGRRADFRLGSIIFLDGYGSVLLPTAMEDSVRLAAFQRGAVEGDFEAPLREFEPNLQMPAGACEVHTGTAFPAEGRQRLQSALDAGPEIRITGPAGGSRLLPRPENAGSYEDPVRAVLPAGRYRVENGTGGAAVGAFSLETDAITIRLISRPDRIRRDAPLRVTWDWGGPPDHVVTIFGSSRGMCGRDLVSFTCNARAGDGAFTIPTRVLALLPASSQFFGVPDGKLTLVTTAPGGLRRFTAPGLDLGVFLHIAISSIQPFYE